LRGESVVHYPLGRHCQAACQRIYQWWVSLPLSGVLELASASPRDLDTSLHEGYSVLIDHHHQLDPFPQER
jgi:hypothetical protein